VLDLPEQNMDRMFCADQIKVPQALPALLKDYTKEVIRFNPRDIVAFSRDYFDAMSKGQLDAFLARQSMVCIVTLLFLAMLCYAMLCYAGFEYEYACCLFYCSHF
jgi:Regulatory subunit of type II PKA R-subunit